jgi:hypothetical protein
MTLAQRAIRKGGFPTLSLLIAACCACVIAALVSCSSSFKEQERLVNDLFEAARNQEVSKAAKLMLRLSHLTLAQQRAALDNLSQIGTYKITDSRREGDTLLVTVQYAEGSNLMTLTIPVRKQSDSWIIGNDLRVWRSLLCVTFERTAP